MNKPTDYVSTDSISGIIAVMRLKQTPKEDGHFRTIGEIASELGIHYNTVRSRIKGAKKLEQAWKEYQEKVVNV